MKKAFILLGLVACFALLTAGINDRLIQSVWMEEDKLCFEGSTDNQYETCITVADPSSDLTLTLGTTATATTPSLMPDSTDSNTGIGSNAADQLSLIAGGVEIARVSESTQDQLIISPGATLGAEATPSLAFGDGDTGFYENTNDNLRLAVGGGNRANLTASVIASNTGNSYSIQHAAGDETDPIYAINGVEDTGIGTQAADQLSITAGGAEIARAVEGTLDYFSVQKGLVGATDAVSAVAGSVAASVETVTSLITTDGDGADAVSLADGAAGQIKILVLSTEGAGGDTCVITPANLNGGTTITLDALGDSVTLVFDGTAWNVLAVNATTGVA